jgi:hypothetical protein
VASRKTKRKARITLSLDSDTARFLKQFCVRTHAPSVSACVEEMIAERRRSLEVKSQNRQIRAYYDSISDHEAQEEAAWGELAEGELPAAGQ